MAVAAGGQTTTMLRVARRWDLCRAWPVAAAAPLGAALALAALQHTPDSADLRIYRGLAQAALAGHDPYGGRYADFPPLKMLLFAGLERAGLWGAFLCAVAVLHAVLLCASLSRRYAPGARARLYGVATLALPGVTLAAWYGGWEDKGVYVVLALALLLLVPDVRRGARPGADAPARGRLLAVGALCGLMQDYGGLGLALVPALLLCWARRWRERTLLLGAALAAVLMGHLPYWPGWLAGYAQRSGRMHLAQPAHQALYLLQPSLYRPALPTLLTLLALALTLLLLWRRRLGLHAGCALLLGAGLAFGPDAGYERILAAWLPLLYLGLHRPRLALPQVALLYILGVGLQDVPLAPAATALVWAGPLCAVLALASRAPVGRSRRPPPGARPPWCPRSSWRYCPRRWSARSL